MRHVGRGLVVWQSLVKPNGSVITELALARVGGNFHPPVILNSPFAARDQPTSL
jgi:hypothetical protein